MCVPAVAQAKGGLQTGSPSSASPLKRPPPMAPGLLPQTASMGAKSIKHVKTGAYAVPASAFLSPAPAVVGEKGAETPEQRASRKAAKVARKEAKAARQGGGEDAEPAAAAPAKKRSREATAPADASPPAKAPKVERMSAEAYRAAHEIKVCAVGWAGRAHRGGAAPAADDRRLPNSDTGHSQLCGRQRAPGCCFQLLRATHSWGRWRHPPSG